MKTIFSVTYGSIMLTRGTPMRIKKLVKFAAEDPEVRLFVFSFDEYIDLKNINHIRFPKNFLGAYILLHKYYKKQNPDLVIGHTLTAWKFIYFLKILKNAPVYFEMHSFFPSENYKQFELKKILSKYIKQYLQSDFLKRCDIITTPWPKSTDLILKYSTHVKTLYDGANTEIFNSTAKKNVLSPELKESDIVIGYAGNSRPYQGLSLLIEGYKKVNKIQPRFKLFLLLSDTERPDYSDSVLVSGPVAHEDVPKYLNSCDILVAPMLAGAGVTYSLPSKIFEYLAMSKPLIASRLNGIEHIVEDNVSALLFTANDVDDLVEKILSLQSESKRLILATKGQELVFEKYSQRLMKDNFLEIIKT